MCYVYDTQTIAKRYKVNSRTPPPPDPHHPDPPPTNIITMDALLRIPLDLAPRIS